MKKYRAEIDCGPIDDADEAVSTDGKPITPHCGLLLFKHYLEFQLHSGLFIGVTLEQTKALLLYPHVRFVRQAKTRH